ncbi:phage portal protein [Mycolicibacterium setense]
MNVEHIRLPGLSDDEDRLLNRLLEQLDSRRGRNVLRAAYYDGKRAIKQVGTVIPPQYYHLGIVLGWSAKAVDILARRCNLDGFVWPDGDIDSLGLSEVVENNYLYTEFSAAGVSSLLHGVVFSINTAGADREPKSLIHFKDALNATGDYNGRTRRLDNLLSITSRDGEGNPTGIALYLDGETLTSDKEDGKWSQVERTFHDWGVPVEAVPYQPRIGRPMGRSRISRPVMSLHDQALRTVIRMEGHMDVYSFPEMWMLGADASVFKNPDGSLKPVWQTMLARIKGIPDNDDAEKELARADVKQFPASSPQPHLDALKQQAQLFSGETSIPLTSLGVSDMSNPTSADSYIASREDLIAEAEGATDDWSPPLRRTLIRALAIQNDETKIPPQWSTIDAKWRSPMYLSRAAQADAGMKQMTAVPWLADTEVGLELLGLDEQQIKRAMADKRRAEGRQALTALIRPQPVTEDDSANAG